MCISAQLSDDTLWVSVNVRKALSSIGSYTTSLSCNVELHRSRAAVIQVRKSPQSCDLVGLADLPPVPEGPPQKNVGAGGQAIRARASTISSSVFRYHEGWLLQSTDTRVDGSTIRLLPLRRHAQSSAQLSFISC